MKYIKWIYVYFLAFITEQNQNINKMIIDKRLIKFGIDL